MPRRHDGPRIANGFTALAALLALAPFVAGRAGDETATPPPAPAASPEVPAVDAAGRVSKGGVAVEFSVGRPGGSGDGAAPLLEGELAEVRFRLSDTSTGLPIRGNTPGAWMDVAGTGGPAQPAPDCREKVALYLKGIVGVRPLVDLNGYHLLVMNQDASISVIDPVVNMTGRTSLYTLILLASPPADWVKSSNEKHLYVSTPRAGQVAVVDLETFKVAAAVPAGRSPTRVALQPDGRYLWVGNDAREDAESGVTVIDTRTRKAVARIATGRGHHEIAFSPGSRHAFVTNRGSGTVSVIDVERLRKVKQLKTGPLPIAAAASPLSQAIYVADGKDGQISVVDGSSLTVRKRIAARPGLGPMRFGPDGRWGFVVNPVEQAVHVVDAAEDRLAHTVPVPGQPYQVGFTRAFAYLRLLDSERVAMLSLSALAGGQAPAVQGFAAGSKPPKLARDLSLADAVAQAATEAAVFVASPADGAVYYYMEGMNAPSGSYGGYGHGVRAAAIADRSLREVEPGVYAGTVRLPEAGRYQVPFLLESPRILHCFAFEARPNPLLGKAGPAVLAEYPGLPLKVSPGGLALRVRLQDPGSLAPITAIPDVRVSYFRAPGEARTEVPAGEVGDGLYEARLPLEKPGTYYLYLAIPSRKLKYGDLAYRTLVVSGATAPAAGR